MTDRRAVVMHFICMLLLSCSLARGQAPNFQLLTDPTGSGTWMNYALSHDGNVMAANYGGFIYRWTPNTPKFPF